jgi:hypothetical protein
MEREPMSHLRRVALASVDVHFVTGVFNVAVDEVFAVESFLILKQYAHESSRHRV